MHASYPHYSMPDEAYLVTLEDWDLLFDAVLTRLRDTVVCDTGGQRLSSVMLECLDTLEQLRRSHPLVRPYVR